MARKKVFEGFKAFRERCRNPWNGKCENTDIQLYILYHGEKLPICSKCWSEICESDLEWGEEELDLAEYEKAEAFKRAEKVNVKCMR